MNRERSAQTWDPEAYAANVRFVSELGKPVVDLLAPGSGERILDLGCGDGELTAHLRTLGCRVVGVDGSLDQLRAAARRHLRVAAMDGHALSFSHPFDAVFSNAALHWMLDPDAVIEGVWHCLREGGRFVAECGGHGCIARIAAALEEAVGRRGLDPGDLNPWYFPTPEEYARRLRMIGFTVGYIELIPRPTPLPGDIVPWLRTLANAFYGTLPAAEYQPFLEEVRLALEPLLRDENGVWVADYVRLRFDARKPG